MDIRLHGLQISVNKNVDYMALCKKEEVYLK